MQIFTVAQAAAVTYGVPGAIATLIRLIPAWGVEDAAAAFGNANLRGRQL